MLRFHNYFKQSPQNKLSLKNNTQLAYAGQWKKIYSNTEIDRWYVGDYSSANYTITVEFTSNKKEVLQVLVVARPDQATVTVYGRTSIDDSLINISAVVTNSYLSLIANVTDTAFLGTKVIFFANYAECILPLSLAETPSFIDSSNDGGGYDGGGAGGSATSFSQLSGTIGLSQIPNGLITPAKLNLNNSLIPSADVIHDLGSAAYRWRDLYLSGSSIQLGNATITASGNSVILPSGSTIAGAAINSFSTIQVTGQSNIVADSVSDSLTIVAGPGIEITTDAGSDSITITNTGSGGSNSVTVNETVPTNGTTGLTLLFSGDSDDAFASINLPFNILFLGVSYNQLFVATNGYINFETGTGGLGITGDGNDPPYPHLGFFKGDKRLLTLHGGVVDAGVYTLRWEGYNFGGSSSNKTIVEIRWFQNSNTHQVRYTTNANGTTTLEIGNGVDTAPVAIASVSTLQGYDIITTSSGSATGVSSGTASRLAYYASTGSVVQDTGAGLTWNGSTLSITGTISASGAVSYVRAYFDTLVELQAVSAATWHGMVAHVHATGRMYFAHSGAWAPLANYSDLNYFSTIAVAGQSNVVADSVTDTLTLVAGTNVTITTNATTDAITINAAGGGASTLDDLSDVVISDPTTNQVLKYDGTNWVNGTDSTGGVGSVSDSFTTIAVAGQSNIVADSSTDTLTLVAGTGISIATNAGTDTVTITSTVSAGATNLDGLTDVIITSASSGQVLKYNGSNWINDTDSTSGSTNLDALTDVIITSASNGQVLKYNGSNWINDTASVGVTAFTGLSDVSSASLTVDKFYLPAITQLAVTANGSSAYRFDQYGTTDNPTIYAISGTTIAFDLSVGLSSHPFLIRFSGANYNTGLVHVTTAGVVTTGTSAQGKTSGTLYWKIPAGISGTYGYLCSAHGGMVGTITVKDISAI